MVSGGNGHQRGAAWILEVFLGDLTQKSTILHLRCLVAQSEGGTVVGWRFQGQDLHKLQADIDHLVLSVHCPIDTTG